MRRGTVTWLLFVACAAGAYVWATEPDGRVAFRYEWLGEKADPGQPRKLRLSVTALVVLDDAQLEASAPSGADKFLTTFPRQGLALGRFAAGSVTVMELDVVEPVKGGEVLTISLRGEQDGVPVREAVGIPVGTPGTEPTLRHGAVEFPAARDGSQP